MIMPVHSAGETFVQFTVNKNDKHFSSESKNVYLVIHTERKLSFKILL